MHWICYFLNSFERRCENGEIFNTGSHDCSSGVDPYFDLFVDCSIGQYVSKSFGPKRNLLSCQIPKEICPPGEPATDVGPPPPPLSFLMSEAKFPRKQGTRVGGRASLRGTKFPGTMELTWIKTFLLRYTTPKTPPRSVEKDPYSMYNTITTPSRPGDRSNMMKYYYYERDAIFND
jgi:hypothetical protein